MTNYPLTQAVTREEMLEWLDEQLEHQDQVKVWIGGDSDDNFVQKMLKSIRAHLAGGKMRDAGEYAHEIETDAPDEDDYYRYEKLKEIVKRIQQDAYIAGHMAGLDGYVLAQEDAAGLAAARKDGGE